MLTDKEELLCHEYLLDLNQTRAYMRVFPDVTYDSARTLSSKEFAKINIRTRIKELMHIRSENILVDPGYVIQSLIHIAEKCQQEEEVKIWDYEAKELVGTGEYKFDSQGANKALELIGKHLAMFTEKSEVKTEHSGIIIQGQKFADQNNAGEK